MFDRVREKIAGRLRSLAELPLPERLAPLRSVVARAAQVVGGPVAAPATASRAAPVAAPVNEQDAHLASPKKPVSSAIADDSPAIAVPSAGGAVVAAAAVARSSAAHGQLGDPQKPAQVYGRATDLWTSRAVDLLRERSVAVEFVELENEEHAGLDDRLVVETKHQRAPFVFLRGQFVGGFNQLDAIDRFGQLDERTAAPGSAPKSPATRTKIVLLAGGDDEPPYGESR